MGQAGNFDTPANEARGTGTAWSAQITVDSEHANVKGAPELGVGLPFQRGISEPRQVSADDRAASCTANCVSAE